MAVCISGSIVTVPKIPNQLGRSVKDKKNLSVRYSEFVKVATIVFYCICGINDECTNVTELNKFYFNFGNSVVIIPS